MVIARELLQIDENYRATQNASYDFSDHTQNRTIK